jgi:hypothetical protein
MLDSVVDNLDENCASLIVDKVHYTEKYSGAEQALFRAVSPTTAPALFAGVGCIIPVIVRDAVLGDLII